MEHNPNFQKEEPIRCEPNPCLFGFMKTYWTVRCCGRAMVRHKAVQTVPCEDGNGTQERMLNDHLAFCSCCGTSYGVTNLMKST